MIKQILLTNHTLLDLACEQMVFRIRQVQRNNWVKQPKNNVAQGLENP